MSTGRGERRPGDTFAGFLSGDATKDQRNVDILLDTIAEVSCPTRYFAEASSINLSRSIKYGFGCLATSLKFKLAKMGLISLKQFPNE